MAAPVFTNFAESTVEEYFDIGDTTLVINSADTAKFPTALTSGDYFFCALFDGENDPELVKVTDVSGTTFTCSRAQESSTEVAWAVGTYVRLVFTADQIETALADIVDHEARIVVLEAASATPLSGDFLFCHGFLAPR